ncbi:hypothetical protein [Streptomyces sp. NEAU-174]|uniref:hypothetical protein n=1 Tax=Streptomyces sp. NEAU-174 TaxID=3458254 RepID=UPI004043DFDF
MRSHLAAHPDLRRNRTREQEGAGNLPPEQRTRARRQHAPQRTAPTSEQIEPARVWSGDIQSVREMSDDQLAAAMRSNLLDDRARARVEAEADRRDLEQLLARVRPGGTMGPDLTPFSDSELARAFPHLDDADALRVMAEMDRRDLASRLPSVRPELVGLSDHDLAARARRADPATLALLTAEAARRNLLARLFPGGNLLADLTAVSDDELAWCMQYATTAELDRIVAEFDRREAVDLPAPADTGNAVDDLLADRDALADAMQPAPDPEQWGALANDEFWEDLKEAAAKQHRGDDGDQEQDERRRITRREARALYDEYVYRQYLAAEDACNGYLLNAKAKADGINPATLFSGPARIAYARASDELKEWWAEHGRLTQAEWYGHARGDRQGDHGRPRGRRPRRRPAHLPVPRHVDTAHRVDQGIRRAAPPVRATVRGSALGLNPLLTY